MLQLSFCHFKYFTSVTFTSLYGANNTKHLFKCVKVNKLVVDAVKNVIDKH